jgi:hypothetical protein
MITMAIIQQAPRFAVVTLYGAVIVVAGGINILLHGLALPFSAAQVWAAKRVRAMTPQ